MRRVLIPFTSNLFSDNRMEKALVFYATALKSITQFMMIRLAILPLILALNFSMCKRSPSVTNGSQPVTSSPSPVGSPSPGIAGAAPSPKITKPVVDQTAQTIIFCYHRLVDKIRYPGTEITPAAFEAEMKQLKDAGI